MWWDRTKFIIENLRTIVFCGAVFWILAVLTLQLVGLIDVEAQCHGKCLNLIEQLIHTASAAPLIGEPAQAPLTVVVRLLP